jgi:hypothetical protein
MLSPSDVNGRFQWLVGDRAGERADRPLAGRVSAGPPGRSAAAALRYGGGGRYVTAPFGAGFAQRAGTFPHPRYLCHVPVTWPDERSNRLRRRGRMEGSPASPGDRRNGSGFRHARVPVRLPTDLRPWGVTPRARQTFISGNSHLRAPAPGGGALRKQPRANDAPEGRTGGGPAGTLPRTTPPSPITRGGTPDDRNVRRSFPRERSLYLSDSSLKEDLT